jgi:hypothetical protein
MVKKGTLKVNLDGKEIALKHKKHFYFNAKDMQAGQIKS